MFVPVRAQSRKTCFFLSFLIAPKPVFAPGSQHGPTLLSGCIPPPFLQFFFKSSIILIGHVPIASQRPRKTFATVIFCLERAVKWRCDSLEHAEAKKEPKLNDKEYQGSGKVYQWRSSKANGIRRALANSAKHH